LDGVSGAAAESVVRLFSKNISFRLNFSAVMALRSLAADIAIRAHLASPDNLLLLVGALSNQGAVPVVTEVLGKMAEDCDANRIAIACAGGVQHAVALLLQFNSEKTQESALILLRNLAVCEQCRAVILETKSAVAILVQLLSSPAEGQPSLAVTVLRCISLDLAGRQALTTAGAIAPLVQLLSGSNEEDLEHTLAALVQLAEDDESRHAFRRTRAADFVVQLVVYRSETVQNLAEQLKAKLDRWKLWWL
jgi:hypothetical protein